MVKEKPRTKQPGGEKPDSPDDDPKGGLGVSNHPAREAEGAGNSIPVKPAMGFSFTSPRDGGGNEEGPKEGTKSSLGT